MDFSAIDKMLNQNSYEDAYKLLKKAYDGGKRETELLYRLGRACLGLSAGLKDKDKKKEWIVEGRRYTETALETIGNDGTDLNVLKWAAILCGSAAELLGTKERIQQGYVFKNLLDRALAIEQNDFVLLHMRGRFSYTVANLSWLERTTASALFATPPTATCDDALADFLTAHKVNSKSVENLMYIGKCYLCKNDKTESHKWLTEASKLESTNPVEELLQDELRALLAKCKQ